MDQETLRRKLAEHRPSLQQARGEFAVLVPLVEGPEGLSLLYEVRPAKLHHHSGEVCFPGGRIEPGETPRQCALRETREELGIPAERIELLGDLDFLYLRSEGLMYPVLARLDPAAAEKVRGYAVQAYRACECRGLSRVDFFVNKDTGDVFLNEINTMPGFTPISMYPKAWDATGVSYTELITRLIEGVLR